jgi:septum formation protein
MPTPDSDSRSLSSAPVRVVLASQSPRRRELLALVGIPHTVAPADIDERVQPGEHAIAYCERLSREKAAALAQHDADAIVIGADTIVVIDGDILGKPRDEAEAEAMLARLAGRTHTVFTAVAVASGGDMRSAVEEVSVTFRPLDAATIAAYVATGEPMDKAGAYGIQGYGATIVQRIDGDYFSVMGLPLGRLVDLLHGAGYRYRFGPVTSA